MGPNLTATFVTWAWLPVTLTAYAFMRPQAAYAFSLLGGILLLPEKMPIFKIPGIPEVQKAMWLAILSLLGLSTFHRRVFRRAQFGALEALVVVVVLLSFATAWTNLDPLNRGLERVEGHSLYDGVNLAVSYLAVYAVPLLLARLLFRTSSDLQLLMRSLAILATVYALPFLYEVRMSPQLHMQVYGYMQHDFLQTIRDGGYRPMVFMAHGLAVAVMNSASLLAALSLWIAKVRIGRFSAGWFALLAGGLLAIGRSLGALVFGVFGGAAMFLLRPRTQAAIAAGIGLLVYVYPMLRIAEVIPTEELVEWIAENVNEERAGSLAYRFDNEALLAERASLRPLVGWGGYCRPCVRDPETGEQTSTVDGEWIIVFGTRGTLGFLASFGILLLPLVTTWRRISLVPDPLDRRLLAGLALVVALNVLDLVPNSLFAPALTMTMVGALYAFSQALPDPTIAQDEDQPFARLAELVGRIRAGMDPRGV